MDSKKQESPEALTGSHKDFCPKHKTPLLKGRIKAKYCPDCEYDEEEKQKRNKSIRRCHNNLNLPRRLDICTFDNYQHVNEKSQKAKVTCTAYVEKFPDVGGLIMIGGVGTGKTHLAAAICKAVCDMNLSAKFTTIPRIIRKVRATWKGELQDSWGNHLSEEEVLRKYSNYHLLVIDEIGSQYGTESEKITISEIINNRYNNMRPTIITGNVKLSEAESYLGTRAIDRLKENGQIIIFDWESFRKPKHSDDN